nr:uncharacterized protein LOC112018248 [Quercus suber]
MDDAKQEADTIKEMDDTTKDDNDDKSEKIDDALALELYKNTMTGQWEEVVKTYDNHKIKAIFAKINSSGDTALHIAVSIAPKEFVEKLVNVITNLQEKEDEVGDVAITGTRITNNEGNNPLHMAVSAGRFKICFLLVTQLDGSSLASAQNNAGESPLFLAAFHGNKDIFLCLHLIFLVGNSNTNVDTINPSYKRKDGETILHCAIRWEYFDVACNILQLENRLAFVMNGQGITPLHLLASKPSVFRSGSYLGWWKEIIYYCMYVEELKCEISIHQMFGDLRKLFKYSKFEDENNHNFLKNFQSCIKFCQGLFQTVVQWLKTMAQRDVHCKGRDDVESHEERNVTGQSEDSKHKEDILKLKQKHANSVKIMNELIKIANEAQFDFSSGMVPRQTINIGIATGSNSDQQDGNKRNETDPEEKKNGRGKGERLETAKIETRANTASNGITEMVEQIPKKSPLDFNDESKETSAIAKTETPILLAARYGITEMVQQILKMFPTAINDKSEGKNIVLLAVQNRQSHVLQLLLQKKFVKRKLIHEVDMGENNALHLAAEMGKQKPWLIPGAALQMQWEIKWYEFVKNNMPQHFCYQINKEGKSPEEIFNSTHEELVKKGGEWLNKTSESCSVVAALIATVAFAASTSIPGNINEKSGIPNLENQPELTVFAVSSLVALCFSITALFSFLAILTSRYEQKDFRRDLPKKLLVGLSSLLISITSMLVSFCAGHFFMLKNKLKDKAFLVYAVTCLPIIFFAIQQLPLYVDIVRAAFKKVPQATYKAVAP